MKRKFEKIRGAILAVRVLQNISLLTFIFAFSSVAYGKTANMRIEVNIVQCGKKESIGKACLRDTRCCALQSKLKSKTGKKNEDQQRELSEK